MLEKRKSCVAQGLRVDKVIKTKIWKVTRIVNAMFIRKCKKAISCFQIEVFFLVIFLCVFFTLSMFLSVSFVFLLLFFIRTFDRHWNKKAATGTYY